MGDTQRQLMVNGGFGGTSAAVLMFSFSIKIQVRKMMWERMDVCKVKWKRREECMKIRVTESSCWFHFLSLRVKGGIKSKRG